MSTTNSWAIEPTSATLRRPVALATAEEGKWLLVGNRDAGSVSILETQSRKILAESTLAKRLTDMIALDKGSRLLVLDETENEVRLWLRKETAWTGGARMKVSPTPIKLCVSTDETQAFVASLWTRQLTCLRLSSAVDTSGELQISAVIDLPFAPREMFYLEDKQLLIVAEAFGGRLALVDTEKQKLTGVRHLPGHNIRGLARSPSGKKLLISHQIMSNLAETTHNDIHWGVLMTNLVRWLDLEKLLQNQPDLLSSSHVQLLGDAGNAAGDPGPLVMSADGRTIVALSGVGEVAIGEETAYTFQRLPVGDRPVALLAEGNSVYVANMFSDSISLVDLTSRTPPIPIPLGKMREMNAVERGETLFFDARVAMEGWFSCHSCHSDGHTNGQLNDNFSDDSFGAPKRVLTLLGVGQSAPWAWNGGKKKLEQQIEHSIRSTMQGNEPRRQVVADLAAYLRTLPPPPSRDELLGVANREAIARGRLVFEAQQCQSCHRPPFYTSEATYDVGLKDEKNRTEFNPPSLLGVGQRGPYLHDNRAETLEDLFLRLQHPHGKPLPADSRSDLLHFLRSL